MKTKRNRQQSEGERARKNVKKKLHQDCSQVTCTARDGVSVVAVVDFVVVVVGVVVVVEVVVVFDVGVPVAHVVVVRHGVGMGTG